MPSSSAIVIVAHGSRADAANDSHVELCAELARRTGRVVRPAFLEIAAPSIPEALSSMIADGYLEVSILPHFLAPGNHTTRDIPAFVDAARAQHPEANFEVLPHTGADPGLIALIAAEIEAIPPDRA